MAKIKAKLRSMALRGETTTTRWGNVTFSTEGLAELEVDEEDLPLLAGLKWLVEEPVAPEEVLDGDPPPPETGETGEGAETGETGEGAETSDPDDTGSETVFDTSDSEPTPEALEAIEAEALEAEAEEAADAPLADGGTSHPAKPKHHGSKKSGKRR